VLDFLQRFPAYNTGAAANVSTRRPCVEFLVHIEVNWPPAGDATEHSRLAQSEARRAQALAVAGTIRRLWRIPGQRANWGLWEAADATALHTALESLPLFPWLSIAVHPLAAHPSDPERPGGS
jgi:muconolactone delta-isomerase